MSSAVTSFSSRIRDAGDLERDSKLYGSFRSINKFDLEESKKRTDQQQQQQQQQRRMSKHEDIFLEALIQPVREQRAAKEVIAPLPPSSKSSASKDGQRKRTRKHHNHDKTSRDSSKQRPPRSDNESTEANNPTGSNDNDVDEFMESLRRRTSRNRRRRQNKENQEPIAADDDNEAPFGGSESKRPGLNSSFSGPINNDSSQINNGSRNRRNSLVVKRAFEEPEKRASTGADESVLGNGAGNEIEVGVDQKKPTPRSTATSGSTPSTSRRGSVQQPATTTMTSDSRVIGYFSPLLKSNTLDFVLSPAPQMSNTIVNCKITCQKGIFTEYSFWLDGIVNQGRDLLVMKAHRRVTSTKSYYLITLVNYDNLGLRLEEQSACARVVSNIYRNKFKLELSNSSLSSPSSSPSSVVAINSSTSSSLATSSSNRELLSVSYKSTMGEPTKISANACLCGKENSEETGRVTYFLKNRAPVFDMYRRKYVLEYNGRAKKSSKHNFQVVDESRDTDEVLIQLGKLETGVYSCDYAFPLCALQAFGFALSSLCR